MTYQKYNGLEIYSAKGLHPKVFEAITKLKIKKDSSILILGSGSGSFDKRLIDNGYNNITSCDINKDNYKLTNTNFIKVNLDTQFDKKIKTKYDLIVGLEIIEHLNSPFDFLRSCKNLLNKDGILIVSTPNLHSYNSRALFLLKGYPQTFSDSTSGGKDGHGHISPILDRIFRYYLKKLNLELIERLHTAWYLVNLNTTREKVGYIILSFLSIILFPFMMFNRKLLSGTVSIYVIKNTKKTKGEEDKE